jgi:hypothetical protein
VSGQAPWYAGELAARISTTVVRALARTTGRDQGRTTLGDNGMFVVLQDSPHARRADALQHGHARADTV